MSRDLLFDRYRTTLYGNLQPSDEIAFGVFELNYGPCLPSNPRTAILDLGCGSGAFLRYLDQKGFENAVGAEISREQVDSCIAAGLKNVLLVDDTREFLQGRQQTYEFIMMRDVLEHVEKPEIVGLLERVRDALKAGGLLVLKVPNAVGVAASFTRYMDFTHEVSFTELSLAQLLRSVGFSEVYVKPTKTFYRSKPKGWLFEAVRVLYYRWLRLLYFMECPGSNYPRIFTNTIIAVARR